MENVTVRNYTHDELWQQAEDEYKAEWAVGPELAVGMPAPSDYRIEHEADDAERATTIEDDDVGFQTYQQLQADRLANELPAALPIALNRDPERERVLRDAVAEGKKAYADALAQYGADIAEPTPAASAATLLADASILRTELRDPATASEALEAQAFSLERNLNMEAAQAPSTMDSAALRSVADAVETEEMTAEESREELARKAEIYAGLVARDYRTATDAAVKKFASGLRDGSREIDLSQAYDVPAGVSAETAESMARTRHESVGAALQPLLLEAEHLGIHVRLGSASLSETTKMEQEIATPKRGIRV